MATMASTAGKVAHTPPMPANAVSASRTGGMTITPRISEMAKPCAERPDALKNAAETMLKPAHQTPRI